ncbi:NAD(P)-dependent oxidoreductase [Domibacillus epiphyticus]|uniref:3-hydroxyisobutyrate dehydrogenase n=1 Tax=Domibacillus epiphyticus TaxID=1714355 RepID=A0A1V2A4N3_9BACI|nr:NAD(P)-dependent oxidoreductase [Domibacillus epiphyticus]OMP65971.1 hypothetical protein BTO28_14350 [Domibacillus epiphyticus]
MNNNIGFIGLGKMGLPMAKNLLKNGFTVFGSDVDETAINEFKGSGGKTGMINEWIHSVHSIILMLPSSTIVNQVVDDIIELYHPAAHHGSNHLLVIDMSSSYPSETRKNGKKLKNRNIDFVDAPVSGGVKKAISASLSVMVGGRFEDYQNCKRLLDCVAEKIFYIGDLGNGHLLKVMNNYLSAGHLLMASEAIHLLADFNVDPKTAIEVINQSSGRSGSTDYKFPSFILNEEYNSGFSLRLMEKDVMMANQVFKEYDAATTLPQSVFHRFNEASAILEKEADHTEIFKFVAAYLTKKGAFK